MSLGIKKVNCRLCIILQTLSGEPEIVKRFAWNLRPLLSWLGRGGDFNHCFIDLKCHMFLWMKTKLLFLNFVNFLKIGI